MLFTCHKNCPYKIRVCSMNRMAFMIFLLFTLNTIAATDTTKTKQQYDINDPRNPDCPCHKYQKLAEEEYALKYGSSKNNEAPIAVKGSKTNTNFSHFESPNIPEAQIVTQTEQQIRQKKDVESKNKKENEFVTIIKPVRYGDMTKSVNTRPHCKKTLWHKKIAFRFYLIGKRLKSVKIRPRHHLCFKWN